MKKQINILFFFILQSMLTPVHTHTKVCVSVSRWIWEFHKVLSLFYFLYFCKLAADILTRPGILRATSWSFAALKRSFSLCVDDLSCWNIFRAILAALPRLFIPGVNLTCTKKETRTIKIRYSHKNQLGARNNYNKFLILIYIILFIKNDETNLSVSGLGKQNADSVSLYRYI